MKTKILFAFLLLNINLSIAQVDWQPIGPDSDRYLMDLGSYESRFSKFRLDSNDTPYISFTKNGRMGDQYDGGILKWDGKNWKLLGDKKFYTNLNDNSIIDFAISSKNEIYVIYTNENSNLAVEKFDGIEWISLGTISSNVEITMIDIAIDNQNVPYIAYNDVVNKKVITKKYTGTAWVNLGNLDSVKEKTGGFDLVINPINNIPYLTYSSVIYLGYYYSDILYIKKFDGQNWITTFDSSSTFSNTIFSNPMIYFDANNEMVLITDSYGATTTYRLNNGILKYISGVGSGTGSSSTYITQNKAKEFIAVTNSSNTNSSYALYKLNEGTYSRWSPFKSGYGKMHHILYDSNDNLNYINIKSLTENTEAVAIDIFTPERIVNNSVEKLYSFGISNSKVSNLKTVMHNNTTYVAYYNNENGFIEIKKNNGKEWELVGLPDFEIYPYVSELPRGYDKTYFQFAIDAFGKIFVSKMNTDGQIVIKQFTGDKWEEIKRIDNVNNAAYKYRRNFKMEFDKENILNIGNAYSENNDYYSRKSYAKLYKFVNNEWRDFVVGVVGTGDNGTFTDIYKLYFDNNNTAYIITDTNDLNLYKNVDGTFEYLTDRISQICFDKNNNQYRVYHDGNSRRIQFIESSKNSPEDYKDITFNSDFDTTYDYTLTLDNNNIPYIAFKSSNSDYSITTIKVKKFSGNSWDIVGNEINTTSKVQNLLFDSNNTPILVLNDMFFYAKYLGQKDYNLDTSDYFVNTDNKTIVYPNPVNDNIFISNLNADVSEINIYNYLGQLILNKEIIQNDIEHIINVSNLPSGNYLLQILSSSKTETIKIVKE